MADRRSASVVIASRCSWRIFGGFSIGPFLPDASPLSVRRGGTRKRQARHLGYRLREAERPAITIIAVGVAVIEACAAADELAVAGIPTAVICLTSPDLIVRAQQARRGLTAGDDSILDQLFPPERRTPLVTSLDGHPHALAFLSGVTDTPIACLGAHDFGQSGDVDDLYRHFGIDTDTIVGAALDLLELT
jgi:pyruvate dehydrogenase E1 component